MEDMLSDAVDDLNETLAEHAAKQVVYRNAALTDSVTLTVTVGSSLLKVTDPGSGAVRIIRTDRDFMFPAAALVLSGTLTEPERGAVFDETVGSVTRRYQVLPLGKDEPMFRYSDRDRKRLRVHTKYQGTV